MSGRVDKGAHQNIRQRRAFQRINSGIDPLSLPVLPEVPTDVQAGDIWYSSEFDDIQAYIGGNIVRIGGLAYVALGDTDYIANSTAETRFDTLNVDNSRFVLMSESIDKKRVLQFNLEGDYSCTGTPTLDLRLKAGGTTLYDLGPVTLSAGTSKQWYTQFTTIIRNVTDAAKMYTYLDHARLDTNKVSGTLTAVDLDFTRDYNISMSVQWSAASASNKIRLRRFTVMMT